MSKKDKNWSHVETTSLIETWKDHEMNLSNRASVKKVIYQQIANDLEKKGVKRSYIQIQRKISKLRTEFRDANTPSTGSAPSTFPFLTELEPFLGSDHFSNPDLQTIVETSVGNEAPIGLVTQNVENVVNIQNVENVVDIQNVENVVDIHNDELVNNVLNDENGLNLDNALNPDGADAGLNIPNNPLNVDVDNELDANGQRVLTTKPRQSGKEYLMENLNHFKSIFEKSDKRGDFLLEEVRKQTALKEEKNQIQREKLNLMRQQFNNNNNNNNSNNNNSNNNNSNNNNNNSS